MHWHQTHRLHPWPGALQGGSLVPLVPLIRRPLGQGVSELLLGGGFTSPYPLRLDPGASRAALPMAISLCLSRKSRSLGPQNAQNANAKGGGVQPRGSLGPFPSPGGRNGARILHPALTPHPRRMSFSECGLPGLQFSSKRIAQEVAKTVFPSSF